MQTLINLAPDILLYSAGMMALLILFLPFSPMTINLVMLSRDKQVWIYRHRRAFWVVAVLSFLPLLLRAFTGLADPTWQWISVSSIATMAVAFWSGYVPFVMTPPARQQLLDIDAGDKLLKPDDWCWGSPMATPSALTLGTPSPGPTFLPTRWAAHHSPSHTAYCATAGLPLKTS